MIKKINLKLENTFQQFCEIPLVKGDINAYKLMLETNTPLDGCMFNIKVVRQDNVVISDVGAIDGTKAIYTLKNNMYDVVGELNIYLAISDLQGGYLTEKHLIFNVIDTGGEANLTGDDRVPALTNLIIQCTDVFNKCNQVSIYAKNEGDYALHSADYAMDQGNYAKEQGNYAKQQGDDLSEELAKKIDKSSIVQVTGNSAQNILSQKATTDILNTKVNNIDMTTQLDLKANKTEVRKKIILTKDVTFDTIIEDGVYYDNFSPYILDVFREGNIVTQLRYKFTDEEVSVYFRIWDVSKSNAKEFIKLFTRDATETVNINKIECNNFCSTDLAKFNRIDMFAKNTILIDREGKTLSEILDLKADKGRNIIEITPTMTVAEIRNVFKNLSGDSYISFVGDFELICEPDKNVTGAWIDTTLFEIHNNYNVILDTSKATIKIACSEFLNSISLKVFDIQCKSFQFIGSNITTEFYYVHFIFMRINNTRYSIKDLNFNFINGGACCYGIVISGTSAGIISNNYIYVCGDAAMGGADGIDILNTIPNNLISNNVVITDGDIFSDESCFRGIFVSGKNNVIINNGTTNIMIDGQATGTTQYNNTIIPWN